MKCPFCDNEDTKVLDSRQVEEGTVVRRRRECDGCLRRFTTYEKYVYTPLIVVKKDGRREKFSRVKINQGMLRACEKRPISIEEIEEVAYTIEKGLRNSHECEVSSKEIGEAVMQRLFNMDEVAYIRFASVYRQFTDVQHFMRELEELVQRKV
ncbi:MAG: transcriptional regulator NrdR [Desulfitobacteriaceae bacterium]|nr:transcriptional regulator NrdR [Desulfitobacteriaceae bacterium]MDD4345830.1 transcriptional regulator NrdR [Desulfitobacteriaceae bacterium]MDD4402643.1 transcriptional regulator NrdR [Desulfitobacteriaceae bacterium]